jgi:hypothetical protein
MSKTVKKFLVVRADGSARVVATRPNLRLDEFAYQLNIAIPDAWSRIIGQIDLTLPDPADLPAVQVRVEEAELP